MYDRMMDHCAKLSIVQVLLFGLVLALAIEAFTVWTRFGLGLQSTRDTGVLASVTFGLRIHHGYLGVVLALVILCLPVTVGWRNAVLMVAVGLIVSDLAHHFLVLWPITGSPEFHLVYPSPKQDA